MSVELEELRFRLLERVRSLLDYCAESCDVMDECIEFDVDVLERDEVERYLAMSDEELRRVVDDWVWACRDVVESVDNCIEFCEAGW